MQGRLLAKIASGSVRHDNEQVGLDRILNQLLDVRSLAQQRGARLVRKIRPVVVIIDQDMVTALMEAALDWAIEPGLGVEVTLEIKDWPAHGLLRIKTTRNGDAHGPPSVQEKLSWHLVSEIGRAVGATIDRVKSPGETLLMIEFPRTVREMEGLTAMEVELEVPSAIGSSSRVLAGHSVLIVSSDIKLREEVKQVCRKMGLTVDNVPSSQLAAQRCEVEPPDLIVVDERFNDERFEALRSRLTIEQPNFPLVEIAYARDQSSALAGWSAGGITRVSRSRLAAELPQALALEMSKLL